MATPYFADQVRLAKLARLRRYIAQVSDKKREPINPLAALFQLLPEPELPDPPPPGNAH